MSPLGRSDQGHLCVSILLCKTAFAMITADWLSTPTCTGDGERLDRRTPPASVRPEVMASPASLEKIASPSSVNSWVDDLSEIWISLVLKGLRLAECQTPNAPSAVAASEDRMTDPSLNAFGCCGGVPFTREMTKLSSGLKVGPLGPRRRAAATAGHFLSRSAGEMYPCWWQGVGLVTPGLLLPQNGWQGSAGHGWCPSLIFNDDRESSWRNVESLKKWVKITHSVICWTVPGRMFKSSDCVSTWEALVGVVKARSGQGLDVPKFA